MKLRCCFCGKEKERREMVQFDQYEYEYACKNCFKVGDILGMYFCGIEKRKETLSL